MHVQPQLRMGALLSNMANLLAGGKQAALGSIGCFGFQVGQGQTPIPLLLGNEHVLFADGAQAGDLLFQPGMETRDGQLHFPEDQLVVIAELTSLRFLEHYGYAYQGEAPKDYFIDIAAARLLPDWAHAFVNAPPSQGQHPVKSPKLARIHPADVGLGGTYPVWKQGQASGRTEGVVLSALEEVEGPDGELRRNVIRIQATGSNTSAFCSYGDSGAPLLNRKGDIVGILWGMDPKRPGIAYASHIHPSLHALGIVLAQPYHTLTPKGPSQAHNDTPSPFISTRP